MNNGRTTAYASLAMRVPWTLDDQRRYKNQLKTVACLCALSTDGRCLFVRQSRAVHDPKSRTEQPLCFSLSLSLSLSPTVLGPRVGHTINHSRLTLSNFSFSDSQFWFFFCLFFLVFAS